MKLEHINAELVSKKKFTFKSKIAKNKNTTESSTLQASEPSQVSDSDAGKVNDPPYSVIGAPDRSKSRDDSESSESLHSRSSCMIRDMENSTIVRDLKNQEDSEIILQNLINCSVYIRGVYRAMYAHNLRGCKVFSGPITGSSLIEEIEECTMMLASQQIRIHNAKMSDMYLRVRSRPIVEYTERVRFAPYAFTYSGIENDLSFANLHEETGLWEHVDDFRWLRAIPSPNWSVLPEEERIGLVDGSSLEL
ncbi:hypothetical protein KP509_27G013300 [Ceratopteris richardii]|nr:hypothetical protein KP509_27G013300 [Ceratopteris richardii]